MNYSVNSAITKYEELASDDEKPVGRIIKIFFK